MGEARTSPGAGAEGGGRSGQATDRRASFAARTLEGLDTDPDVAVLRDRCAAASTPGEIRAMQGAWTAAVLRALWRAATSASADGGGAGQPVAAPQ